MIAAHGNQLRHQTRDEITTIGRCAFARLVVLHCRISGHEPDAADVDQWVSACWPWIEEQGMDPARWALAYLIAVGLVSEPAAP